MERKKKYCVEFMWSPEYQMTILRTCLHVASNLKVTPRLLNFFRICSDARIFQDQISLSMVYLFRCGQILRECEKKDTIVCQYLPDVQRLLLSLTLL